MNIFVSHRRGLSALVVAGALAAGLAVAMSGGQNAKADTIPLAGAPATVSADGLPTVQVNGVVWSQVVVGNTVYATGSFTKARPAGSAPGKNETAAGNILAYDIRTGLRIATFNHTLNAQGLDLAASADGSRLYVGGDFTTVDGIAHSRIAAFSTLTGALDNTFTASVGYQVRTIAVAPTTVFVGGSFQSAGGQVRKNLAAFTPAGKLTSWAPTADDNFVTAMVMAPGNTKVVVGGRFTTMNKQPAYGMGAINAATGASMPWVANQKIRDASLGAIFSLTTDGTAIYGTGGTDSPVTGNFEGRFAADPSTGAIIWADDCHGDSYDAYPVGKVLYSTGHAHDCTALGQMPHPYSGVGPITDLNKGPWLYALAQETVTNGETNAGPDTYGWDYSGIPATKLLQWYPDFAKGTYTSSAQAAWSITGNATYVAVGGEFPSVNGIAQQGLVRFAIRASAPDKIGPQFNAPGNLAPTVKASAQDGAMLVAWTAAWDKDSQNLAYQVVRDGQLIYATTAPSSFWQTPRFNYTDTAPTAGKHSYQTVVADGDGNKVSSPITTVTVAKTGTPVPTSANLALGRPTSESSFFEPDGEPSRAVDGNTSGDWASGHSITRTADTSTLYPWWQANAGGGALEVNPWWQLDLQADTAIAGATLWNRTDCCQSGLSNYYLFASSTPLDTALSPAELAVQPGVWSSTLQAEPPAPSTTITFPAGLKAHYLLVEDVGGNQLSVAEVQVTAP